MVLTIAAVTLHCMARVKRRLKDGLHSVRMIGINFPANLAEYVWVENEQHLVFRVSHNPLCSRGSSLCNGYNYQ